MGIANIIPGVSGGTLALTLGIYEQFIGAISHFFEKFKENIQFLIPIFIGMALAIISMSNIISSSFENYPIPTTLFFIGLVLGGIPMLLGFVKGKKEQKEISSYVIAFLTFALVIILAFSEQLFGGGLKEVNLGNVSIGGYLLLFLVGVIAAATMVIPGVSGSLVLMLLGYYIPVVNTIKDLTKFNHIFSKLTKRGRLTELEIKEAMREVRIALLEADVNYMVAKDFVKNVSEKAVGDEVLKSLTPAQQVIKIVRDELTSLMTSQNQKLAVSPAPPTVIMMCGLQGAGKTTMCGKLGAHLKKTGKKILLVACDIYRPAAINQLQVVGKQANVEVFERGTQNPVKTSREAVAYAKKQGFDTVIIDTAGRLHINEELMKELQDVKKEVSPTEILLVVDSMTGQDAVTVEERFNRDLDITGVVLTKLDGDTRGGAALSIKAITGKPIKFSGVGEKIGDIEPFYPDRIASRILGMGDVLTLIEKAQEAVSEEEAKALEKKLRESAFTFEDYLTQLESLKKMGSLKDILGMIPGLGSKIKSLDIDEGQLQVNKAIIQSMTPEERRNPDIIKASRRQRIAKGSGTSVQQVNILLKQFEQSREMMKQLKGGKFRGMPKF